MSGLPHSFLADAAGRLAGGDDIADDVSEVLAKCQTKLGFVPNVFQAYAHDAGKFRAFRAMSNDLMKGDSPLSELEREMIAVVVSSQNRCHYCLSAHGAAVRALSGDRAFGDALVNNYRAVKLPPRHRAMLDFAAALNDPENLNAAEERGKLMRAGFCHRAVFHICAVAAFYHMTNRIAAAIDLQPNPEYVDIGRAGGEGGKQKREQKGEKGER